MFDIYDIKVRAILSVRFVRIMCFEFFFLLRKENKMEKEKVLRTKQN
jgi:hypothetical protein